MLPSILTYSFFLFYLFIAFFGAFVAFRRGRNPIAWFIGTLFLGFLGIFILFILPPKQNFSEQEQAQNDDFLQNLDSSDETGESPEELFLTAENLHLSLQEPLSERAQWFYLNEKKESIGPLTLSELRNRLLENSLKKASWGKTWIWKKGMKNWNRAEHVQELKHILPNAES